VNILTLLGDDVRLQAL
jgi:hypothetical protein